jgi:putative ABC transport system substrate-binding protein
LRYERLPALAAELVALKPDIIVTIGTAATLAAKGATATIPIAAIAAADPVGSGLARTLSRPGGNVTGVANVDAEATLKRIEMLKALVPAARHVAFFFNPENPVHMAALPGMRPEIERLGVRLTPIPVASAEEISTAFAGMRKERIDSICIPQEAFLTTRRRQFAELALANLLPSIGGFRAFTSAGCLAGFGQNPDESFRMCVHYVDRILNGARPGDLPFLRADKLDLSINLKTAAALSITVPQSILFRADEILR